MADAIDTATDYEQARVTDRISAIQNSVAAQNDDIYCEECGDEIEEARREAMPSATRCVLCQDIFERPGRVRRF
ncbi:TraR/DksA C4-type zinc finger protein [Roseibium sp. RKSG952]|uniref:TraR/DksA C4-type zinc finger protein n=1 Tax=Roseibium sp. RKSG952 TaxID=2529384 RepID=UPI0012BC0774|nr:TraR/DksA C4-type zinc finger protein [Roseibium sp. RKSG952]MTH95986.1 TraR/DksA family transcriptional regulator [Roseibium sp. RKSG952]